jgi:DNA primase
VVWDTEIEARPADTPERRASLQRAIEQRVADIVDPVVRDYYRSDMRGRLDRLRRPERTPWQPGRRRSFRDPAADSAPFPAGAAARRAGGELEGARQERALLGALIERPAMLHILAEDLAALPIVHPELARLRSGLLDALSMVPAGLDPAVEEALADSPQGPPLEARLIEEHLERSGLRRLAAAARAKAREVFRDDSADSEGWVGQWRRAARHVSQLTTDPEELRRAEQALAEDMNEENLGRLRAILDRLRRESLESGTE